jgi:hypothetical protein
LARGGPNLRGGVPQAEVPENFADNGRVVDDGDDPHGIVANGAVKRIHMPNAENKVAPAFWGKRGRRRRGKHPDGERQVAAAARVGARRAFYWPD